VTVVTAPDEARSIVPQRMPVTLARMRDRLAHKAYSPVLCHTNATRSKSHEKA